MNYQFRVKKSERGKRLESFLHGHLSNWSHKKVKQAIDKKKAFVNGKNIFISHWNLKPGDRVEFFADKTDFPRAQEFSRYHHIHVIFEDEFLLVTNKPPFLDYDTFVAFVNAYLKRAQEKRWNKKFYPYLGQMHRLDKETSGLLVFTKKKGANILAEQFRNRTLKKYYLALVEGCVEKEHGIIKASLIKGKFYGGKKVIIGNNEEGAKESITQFWVKERYQNTTLLRILLGTGRTHQIRIHLSAIGHPVMGDKLYGKDVDPSKLLAGRRGSRIADYNVNNDSRTAIHEQRSTICEPRVKRQMLHAHQLFLTHPLSGKKMKFEAPLPPDMARFIDELRTTV